MTALPKAATNVAEQFPDLWKAYESLGAAAAKAGPLDARTQRLVKLAISIGGGSEGATHSHARRAVREGVPAAAMRQVALLAVTSIGFSRAVAGLSWIEDVLAKEHAKPKA